MYQLIVVLTNVTTVADNAAEMDSKCAEITMEMAAQNGVAQLNAVMVNFVKEDFANHQIVMVSKYKNIVMENDNLYIGTKAEVLRKNKL